MSQYLSRPWTKLYDQGQPTDIQVEHASALSMFKAAVQRAGANPAITYFDAKLSYDQVDQLTDALAVALLERGVVRGERLMLVMQNVPQLILGLLAAWKIGAIAVPINPMYRQREFKMLVEDCEPAALIVQQDFYADVAKDVLGESPAAVVITTSELDFQTRNDPRLFAQNERQQLVETLDLLQLLAEYEGQQPPALELGSDDIATIVYTSGTTGAPKGAMSTHANLAFNAQVSRDWIRLEGGGSMLAIAPLFHITGLVGNVCAGLLTASSTILFCRFEPSVVLDAIEEHQPQFTVAAITALIALMNHPQARPEIFTCFRAVFSGGAPVPPAVVLELERRLDIKVRNAYGLTETSATVTIVPYESDAPVDPESGALSIGVPVFNTEARIVDDFGEDVELGSPGELLIRGPQVVAGYWKRPDDDSIVDGWLHTGDIASMDPQGWIFLIDRKKDMINASGYKVWPRDVEDVLYAHPAVMEAAVVPAADPYRGETVKAVLSLKPGASATAEEIIEFCKERMAAFKYPRIVEFLPELPKTPTGKIMRRMLRDDG